MPIGNYYETTTDDGAGSSRCSVDSPSPATDVCSFFAASGVLRIRTHSVYGEGEVIMMSIGETSTLSALFGSIAIVSPASRAS
jgi:hypothetical protein